MSNYIKRRCQGVEYDPEASGWKSKPCGFTATHFYASADGRTIYYLCHAHRLTLGGEDLTHHTSYEAAQLELIKRGL